MAGKESDRFADALHAMSGGVEETESDHAEEHVDETVAEESAAPQVAAQPAQPAPPPPVARSTPPAPPRPSRPASPARSSTPPAAPPPQPAQQSARPARPVTPTPTPTPAAQPSPAPSTPAAAKRPQRPTAPAHAPAPAPAPQAPAPAPVSYARKPVARGKKKKSMTGSLEFRRTLIPPCLVTGAMFVILTLLFFLQPADAALRQARTFLPIGIGVLGVLLIAVGIFNMLLVKKELEHKRQPPQ